MNTSYEHLSRDARINLLGHYLSKMVSLMHADELEQKEIKARRKMDGSTMDTQSDASRDDTELIVTFLRRVRSASAKEISRFAGIARSSMFRRLRRLTTAGVIGRTGMGKQARYGLIKRDVVVGNRGLK